ncbi:unnamed protein product [Polarella glacialis]|uniref:Uncharacterized protein n=1 Tax=Polarella glacialis TaxID=89957 RepID=A0A813GU77_POLGL|nr:unnamed protein product [Polarella glacialis]
MRKRVIGVCKPRVVLGMLWPEHIVFGRVAKAGLSRELSDTEILRQTFPPSSVGTEKGKKLCESPRVGLSNFGPRDSSWPTTTQSEVVTLADALERILLYVKVAENPRTLLPGRPKPAVADVPRPYMADDFGEGTEQFSPRSESPNPAGARIFDPESHAVGDAEFNDLDTQGGHQVALFDFFRVLGLRLGSPAGNSALRTGGVTAVLKLEQTGPAPAHRTLPSSMRENTSF